MNNDCWLTAELVICQQQRLTNWNILQCTGGLGSFVLLYLANATLSTGMLVLEKPLQTAPGVQVKSRTIVTNKKNQSLKMTGVTNNHKIMQNSLRFPSVCV